MASLRQIATELIDSYNIPFDHATYERAKAVIINGRATRLKQDITKNGIDSNFQQSYYIKLVSVDAVDNCEFGVGCVIKRSENKIPRPISYRSDVPFLSVGNVLNPKSIGIELTYANRDQIRFLIERFTTATFYSWINDYIYVFEPKMGFLIVRAIYEDPTLIATNCSDGTSGICYDEDMEFPLPLDMIGDVKTIVRNTDFFTLTDYKEIQIDKH